MVVSYPNQHRNYCIFSDDVINRCNSDVNELSVIKNSLENPKNEEEVIEDLFILNCMLDNGIDKEEVSKLYPTLSKYNDTKSPNIQTYLAGIYRKIKVPDAFGPLVKMLIQDSVKPLENCGFDPTEEIGGAILDYLA